MTLGLRGLAESVATPYWDIGPCSSFRAPEIQKNDRTLWWKDGYLDDLRWFDDISLLFVTNMCTKHDDLRWYIIAIRN